MRQDYKRPLYRTRRKSWRSLTWRHEFLTELIWIYGLAFLIGLVFLACYVLGPAIAAYLQGASL